MSTKRKQKNIEYERNISDMSCRRSVSSQENDGIFKTPMNTRSRKGSVSSTHTTPKKLIKQNSIINKQNDENDNGSILIFEKLIFPIVLFNTMGIFVVLLILICISLYESNNWLNLFTEFSSYINPSESQLIETDLSFGEDIKLEVQEAFNEIYGEDNKSIYKDEYEDLDELSYIFGNRRYFSNESKNNIIKNDLNNNIFSLEQIIDLSINKGKSKINKIPHPLAEIQFFDNIDFQKGISNFFYKIKENVFSYFQELVDTNKELKFLINEEIYYLLDFSPEYELLLPKDLKNEFPIFNINRQATLSSKDYRIIEDICIRILKNQKRIICSKLEILVILVIYEKYKSSNMLLSKYIQSSYLFMSDKRLINNLPYFTDDQMMILNILFPGLIKSYENLTNKIFKLIYKKIKEFDNNIEDLDLYEIIRWGISLIITHSLEDKNGELAFVPLATIIPHMHLNNSNSEFIIHIPTNSSFIWHFYESPNNQNIEIPYITNEFKNQKELFENNNINKDNNKKEFFFKKDVRNKINTLNNDENFTKLYSYYGKLNNIKFLIQYGYIINNNIYSTTWFLRKIPSNTENNTKNNTKNNTENNVTQVLYGADKIIYNLENGIDSLPNWLYNEKVLKKNEMLYHIFNKRKIETVIYNNINKDSDIKDNYLKCDYSIFNNGAGLGIGTLIFINNYENIIDSKDLIGGINLKVYLCLRELMFGHIELFIEKEKLIINFILNNCTSRVQQLTKIKNNLVNKFIYYKKIFFKKNDLTMFDQINIDSKKKQEIRINIMILHTVLEELYSMNICLKYFRKLNIYLKRKRKN
ncbi:hypothetical protein ACR3K2_39110 [Cryptosporidium serpentis]